jgi:hypothetical protein
MNFTLSTPYMHSYVGRMLSRTTYGDRIWDEMGDDLTHWNHDANDNFSEVAFSFWMVNIFHFRKYRDGCLTPWGLTRNR